MPLPPGAQDEPSLQEGSLHTLAEWGVRLEEHFNAPQDIEWVLDETAGCGSCNRGPWRMSRRGARQARVRPKTEPRLEGGRTVYPGRTSGPAFLVDEIQNIGKAPAGSVVFIRKPSPEIVEIFPRIAGLVAEWGNVTGHAAALLREFQIPSVFQMTGAFERLANGEPVSLDAVQARRLSAACCGRPAASDPATPERYRERSGDPISARLLTLNLLDPSAQNFRPAGCKSAHDVLRYCHEKAIEAMFEVNDFELEHGVQCARKLMTPLPLNILVMDLGGGSGRGGHPDARRVAPPQIVSRPFQALWSGISHPGVTWTREMPAAISDLASVLATSFTPRSAGMRAAGRRRAICWWPTST